MSRIGTFADDDLAGWVLKSPELGSAIGAMASGSDQTAFGVMWATARTQVDRVERRVTLENIALTRSNFPTLPDNGAGYLNALQQQIAANTPTIALDRL